MPTVAHFHDVKDSLRIHPLDDDDLNTLAQLYIDCVEDGKPLTRATFMKLLYIGERSGTEMMRKVRK